MSRIAWFRAAPPDRADPLDDTAAIIDALAPRHDIHVVTAAGAHDFVWRHFREPYDVCVYEPGATPAHAFMRAYLAHYPGLIAPRGLGIETSGSSRKPQDEDAASAFKRKELTFGTPDPARRDVVERALDRARAAGADAVLLPPSAAVAQLRDADVVVALDWPPPHGVPVAALHAMAAGNVAIVLEVEATAGWPALDPQTWQPRGFLHQAPVVVSIDPRDEEHSLMLAVRRLAADATLRAALGTAAQAWWREHATLDHALRAWERLLGEAPRTDPERGARDRSERARAILGEMGVAVDFL